jgi:hypothetical protein
LTPAAPRRIASAPAAPFTTSRSGADESNATSSSISEAPVASVALPGAKAPPERLTVTVSPPPAPVTTILLVLVTVAAPQAAPLTWIALPDRTSVALSPAPRPTETTELAKLHVTAAGDEPASRSTASAAAAPAGRSEASRRRARAVRVSRRCSGFPATGVARARQALGPALTPRRAARAGPRARRALYSSTVMPGWIVGA